MVTLIKERFSSNLRKMLTLECYGSMYLLYSVYDGAEEKESASSLLATHIDRFIVKVESDYRKKGRTT